MKPTKVRIQYLSAYLLMKANEYKAFQAFEVPESRSVLNYASVKFKYGLN